MNNNENDMFTLPKCLIAAPILSIVILLMGMFMSFIVNSFGVLGITITIIAMLIIAIFILAIYLMCFEQIFYALFKVDQTRRTEENEITPFHNKVGTASVYFSIVVAIILYIVGYLLYNSKIDYVNLAIVPALNYLSTAPVLLILLAVLFIPVLIRKWFDVPNNKTVNIIHILVIVIGIGTTIPIYNAFPGMQFFESSENEYSGEEDEFGNREYRAFNDAKDEVEKRLKAPSTAKFCKEYEAEILRDGNTWTVEGWVDAENSFGAMLRNKFVVKLTYIAEYEYYVEYCAIK